MIFSAAIFSGALFLATSFDASYAFSPTWHNRRSDANASHLIDTAITKLGGHEALSNLKGVTYQSDEIFHVRTIMQNYHLFGTDRYVVGSGSQNISFSFTERGFSQKIDRNFVMSDYWIFVTPEMTPRNFSMVVKSGDDGFVCFVRGNNLIFIPKSDTYGYADGVLTEYLLFQALKLSPKLLVEVKKHDPTPTTVVYREVTLPAVFDKQLNLTVAFDPETNLPMLIRAFEDHPILGMTSNDLLLFNYTKVDGIQFPQTQKTIYGDEAILEDTVVSQIHVNPNFEQGYFDGLPLNETTTKPSRPKADPDYGHAEVTEYWTNTLWSGAYPGKLEFLNVTHPAEDLPNAHHLLFLNYTNFAQLVLEFKDSVIVFEAPPHQTNLVIQWVKENIKKPISHVWLSHHHHDHSLDAAKFAEIGATVIIPEMAKSYWGKIPGVKLQTFTEDKPFIYSDSEMQVRFLYQPDTPHAADWTYAVVTTACPAANTSMLAYISDAVSTNFESDTSFGDAWVLQALGDSLSKNTTVVPAHGPPVPFEQVIGKLGSPYPEFNSTSFLAGGNICLGGGSGA